MDLNLRIYVQRVLIGLLSLVALVGWLFSAQAGERLDVYWWHLNWVQRVVAAGTEERTLQAEINETVQTLFEGLDTCTCSGDPEARLEQWQRFLALLEAEEQLSARHQALFTEWEQRASLKQ